MNNVPFGGTRPHMPIVWLPFPLPPSPLAHLTSSATASLVNELVTFAQAKSPIPFDSPLLHFRTPPILYFPPIAQPLSSCKSPKSLSI